MSRKPRRMKPRRGTNRRGHVETLESRQVMSADPVGGLLGGAVSHHVILDEAPEQLAQAPPLALHGEPDLIHHTDPNADFWLDSFPSVPLDEQLDQIEKSLFSAHKLTGVDKVKTDYGFSGIGQTVAIIDSGIAYDHYALGAGYGGSYRVVGGFDFTENDSNPYDDGAEGSHGTHVAGIVGANDGTRSGVAPGVDLVGLRVFDDAGNGYFSWVKSALQWVHANRNAFENPITAVNLSLGTSWNSATIPAWANLETEFAQLKADGIFISVSAGNSYATYNEPGLSYPAASPHVVPVMSSDDSGFLSYFSQRHSRAIAAPGRYIYSTIPDYAGNNNGVTDDWANFSGTSMAAPYVAGASVLIREAMEFVGVTGIDQEDIFELMVDWADQLYDSASNAFYNRLNVKSVIDYLMPDDDYGSSQAAAYDLGTITAGPQTQAMAMSGHIAKLGDADYFKFTAGATGTVTFTASQQTFHMQSAWAGMGGVGWTELGGASYTMNVVAGQEYCVALSSSNGLGYYDLTVSAESTFTYTDWGTTAVQETKSGLTVSGDAYYRMQAARGGYVTAQALQTAGVTGVALLNSNLEVVATGSAGRVDYHAQAGEELYLRVTGTASGLGVRLTNAVSVAGTAVTVLGTSGDDALSFVAGVSHTIGLNGVDYELIATSFVINAGAGSDTLTATGSAAVDTATLRAGSASLISGAYSLAASSVESATLHGGGGNDSALFYDSAASDRFVAKQAFSQMTGGGVMNRVYGFATVEAFATAGGVDIAEAYDSPGNDHFWGKPIASVLAGDGYSRTMRGFEYVYAYSFAGGSDLAEIYDSPEDDVLISNDRYTALRNSASYVYAYDFDLMYAYAYYGGYDIALMSGSPGVDTFVGSPGYSYYRGASFNNRALWFENVKGFSDPAGHDLAFLHGSEGDDMLYVSAGKRYLYAANSTISAEGFGITRCYGRGGADLARLSLDAGEAFEGAGDLARYQDASAVAEAREFERVVATIADGAAVTVNVGAVDYAFELIGG